MDSNGPQPEGKTIDVVMNIPKPGSVKAVRTDDLMDQLGGERSSYEHVFAQRVKRERLRRGWRQEDLVARMAKDGLELHPSAIAKIEREPDPEKGVSSRMIRLDEAAVIARAFRMSIDEMLTDNDLSDSAVRLQELKDRLLNEQTRLWTIERQQRNAAAEVARLRKVVRETVLEQLPRSRSESEQYMATWSAFDRKTLMLEDWGSDGRGNQEHPDDIIRTLTAIAENHNDLRREATGLIKKIQKLADWWEKGGRERHFGPNYTHWDER